jgi:glycosyltransferase involved in cell wall biosynthesis
MAHGETISVVIPTFNRRLLLEKNLSAIAAQTLPADRIEVIVVNDGGTDDTDGMIKNFRAGFRLKYVRQEHWAGFPYRVGAARAENDFILFLDDDVIPHPRMLEAHVESHNRFDGLTAVIGRLQWPAEKKLTPFEQYVSRSGMLMGTHLIENPDDVHFKFALGGNFSVPRKIYEDSGGYDNDFPMTLYGYVDIEFGYRLKEKYGARLVYNPEAAADHWYCAPFPRFLEQRELAGKMALIFTRKHPELSEYLKIDFARRRGLTAAAFRACLYAAYRALRPLVSPLEMLHPASRPLLYFAYRLCIFYHYLKGIGDHPDNIQG